MAPMGDLLVVLGVCVAGCLVAAAGAPVEALEGGGSGSGGWPFPWPRPGPPPHFPHPWGPQPTPPHGYRDMHFFNLIDMLPDPQLECALLPHGCPNLAAFESIKHHSNTSGHNVTSDTDVVAFVMSTLGLPATTLTYFHDKSQASFNWESNPLDILKAIITGDFSGVCSFKAAQFSIALAFSEIIEFNDTNIDGVFEPGKDSVLSTYSLHTDAHWGPLLAERVADANDNNTIFQMNVTTTDNVFSLRFATAPSAAKSLDGIKLDPTATKIDVRIEGYPFKASGPSKLALKTFVAVGKAKEGLKVHGKDSIDVGGDGFLKWVETVDYHSHATGKVGSASVGSFVADATENELFNFFGSIGGAIFGAGHADASEKAKVTYFSFDADSPAFLYWDPSFGYGQLGPPSGPGPSKPPKKHLGWFIGGAAAFVACAAVAAIAIRGRKSARQTAEYPPLVPDRKV